MRKGLARARPRGVRAAAARKTACRLALLRDDAARPSVAQKVLFFLNGPAACPRPRIS
jgi:hypothetical protein